MDQTALQPQHEPSTTPDAALTPPTAAHKALGTHGLAAGSEGNPHRPPLPFLEG